MKLLWTIVPALLLCGCVNPANDRFTVGESLKLEAIGPAPRPTEPSASQQVVAPSLMGVSRANWSPTLILVPVDGTVHNPIYARRAFWADSAARQRGEYPSASTSLELIQGSEMWQEVEALNNHARAVTDVFLMPFRMLAWAPWKDRRSPDEAYQRYNHPERREVPAPPGTPQSVTP